MYFLFLRKIFSVIAGKILLRTILFILPIFIGLNLNGQILDVDSTKIVEMDTETTRVHSPQKATIMSAVLPGLGQAYNKKYWKIPLIYVGFGTIGYFIHWNSDNYKTMKLAYNDFTDGNDDTDSYLPYLPPNYDPDNQTHVDAFKTGLSKQQDYYRRNRDLLIISFVGFYGLQLIDASVDAHLFDFDMSDDLSFNWQPTMQKSNNQPVYGVSCTFTF